MIPIILVAKDILLTAVVGAFVFAAGILALLFFFLATYPYNDPRNNTEDIFLCLLNLSTFLLTIPAAIGAFNPARMLYFKRFWPTEMLLAISGTTLLITAAIVITTGGAFALAIIDADVLPFLLLSNIISTLAAALCAAQFAASDLKDSRHRYGVIRFAYIAAVIHAVGIVLFLGQFTDALISSARGPADDTVWLTLAVLWPELAAALLIPVGLSWRGMALPYALLGLAAAVAANSAIWFYALQFYGPEPHLGSILNAVIAAAIPLLLFAVIILRRYGLRSRNRP